MLIIYFSVSLKKKKHMPGNTVESENSIEIVLI